MVPLGPHLFLPPTLSRIPTLHYYSMSSFPTQRQRYIIRKRPRALPAAMLSIIRPLRPMNERPIANNIPNVFTFLTLWGLIYQRMTELPTRPPSPSPNAIFIMAARSSSSIYLRVMVNWELNQPESCEVGIPCLIYRHVRKHFARNFLQSPRTP